ncbi:MAG: VOC family protein [Pseudomonadota bacterium]
MATELALITYLARDYDEAIAWFRAALGFVLIEDTDLGSGKRWVRMAARPDAETGFLIAKAVGAQVTALGRSAGGRVAFFLNTDAFGSRAEQIAAHGGVFEGPPRHEPYGKVAVFRDLYGNRWDLIEPAPVAPCNVAQPHR